MSTQVRAIQRNIKRAKGLPLRKPWKLKSRRSSGPIEGKSHATLNKKYVLLHQQLMEKK